MRTSPSTKVMMVAYTLTPTTTDMDIGTNMAPSTATAMITIISKITATGRTITNTTATARGTKEV
jgi:hypothetical protein